MRGIIEMRKGKFKIYRKYNTLQFSHLPDVYWFFNLIATNGKVLATSETYNSRQSCLKGIASVKRNAPNAVIEEVK